MKPDKDNFIIGLDIGSSKICTAICEINPLGELNLRDIGTSVSSGIERGKITDAAELSKAIDRSIKRASQNLGFTPSKVITNIPFHGIQSIQNMGFILSKEQSGQISEYEKTECIRRSKNIIKSPEQRLLHVIPLSFKVDGNIIQNPVGAFGNNLEVQTHIILGNSDTISGLNYAIKDLELHICGIVYDLLASAQVALTEKERKEGSILIDIGSRFTKVGIFENNLLQKSTVIPIGGETITSDIAHCLKTTIPEAERIKILQGEAMEKKIYSDQHFSITTNNTGRQEIEKNLLCRIIEARLKELFSFINKDLNLKFNKPYQVVLMGGSSSLTGLSEFTQNTLNSPVRIGIPENIRSIIEKPEHCSSVGLIVYGLKIGAIPFPQKKNRSIFSKFFSKLRDLF
jgi:cell division protein FtsA